MLLCTPCSAVQLGMRMWAALSKDITVPVGGSGLSWRKDHP